MRKVFQAELHQVGEELIQIATLVQQALGSARTAFLDADIQVAEEVISNDARIDFLQNDLDERSIDILALQSPVASDLRMIVGALRMSASLERMGDLARHLAQLARLRFPEPVLPEAMRGHFEEMFDIDARLVERVISVLEDRDISEADQIFALKSELNLKHQQVFEMLADPDWDSSVPTAVDVTLASRYLERIGDHGVSVARKVSYLVTGDWAPATDSHPTGHGHIGADAGE
ncbi:MULTISPECIES: phosphate signaling complex protein PhoU [Kocuria]|uniref:phosphate signaling complex protein PhoU n=1 Tax=Kocuria TaxID=57493 RepID=UPI0007E99AC4|nr:MULTISPECIES: phosphate signaling complex protein PhoU [Kocuria]MBN6812690.1 phosphate signaling complex protein PhoU [Kocuria indica]MBN6844292.1 phosphate signaling complex protein PhoU [Kocuria indica]MCG7431902.1 phosphate signaling complex protein PhoU [Kocuria indica]MCT1722639.1 phosphate signaling complex protein PhoU [Kocuria marina]MCT1734336.1 phosphate signaling complex protein PhoU [Kocuria marina]